MPSTCYAPLTMTRTSNRQEILGQLIGMAIQNDEAFQAFVKDIRAKYSIVPPDPPTPHRAEPSSHPKWQDIYKDCLPYVIRLLSAEAPASLDPPTLAALADVPPISHFLTSIASHIIQGTNVSIPAETFGQVQLTSIGQEATPLVMAHALFGADVTALSQAFRSLCIETFRSETVRLGDHPLRDMYFLALRRKGLTVPQIFGRYRQDFPDIFPEHPGTPSFEDRREQEIDLIRHAIPRIEARLNQAVDRAESHTSRK